ncbi:MFS transporter [Streptomyces sp. TP-A0874]|uniref:MFS transporter n=1 Tax=Streptomyces sp. TP-A0874 TaxID=549819 RepID=UPI000852A750|nr:MFS transporter [Streptomyces sp. TP-A0874]
MTKPQGRAGKAGAVVRVTSGNFLEMFDFMVYGFYATAIANAMFPSGNEFLALMLSLVTFGVGFLMRPLGAIVLGAYIDRHGRRQGLILSLSIMGVGVLLLALTPTYATIGALAPILVLVGRLLQGFSAGAESGGVSVYLSEISPPGRRGFYVAWQSASQQVSVVVAALIGVALHFSLSADQTAAWGWRIPFLFGSLIVPFLFYVRRSLQETDDFADRAARRQRPSFREVYRTILREWRIVGTAVLLVTLTSVMFYLITAYTPTFGERELGLSAMDSYTVTLVVGVSNFVWVPVMGAVSDRFGRIPVLITFSTLVAVTGYPVMVWLVADPSFARMMTTLLWLSFLYGGYQGVMVVTLTEMMPAAVRATGFALAYSLAQAVFGGFTPAICTWLIEVTGSRAMPGLWLAGSAVISVLGTLLLARSGALRRGAANDGPTTADLPQPSPTA